MTEKKPFAVLLLLIFAGSFLFSNVLGNEKVSETVDILVESEKQFKASNDTQSQSEHSGSLRRKTNWGFSLGAIGFWAPESAYKTGGTHFSEITGAGVGFALPDAEISCTTDWYAGGFFPLFTATAKASFGISALTENLSLSVRPLRAFPFLSFDLGGTLSEGWFNTGAYNPQEQDFDSNGAFRNISYHAYTKAQILLPLGSTLVIASYQIGYAGLSGMKNSDLWQFSGGSAEFNGWKHNALFSALHVSDSRVNLAGFIVSVGGYLSDNALSARYSGYDPTFTSVSVIPLANVQFSELDSLCILTPFGNRRSFATDHEKAEEEPLLETTGSEWYWQGIFLKYTHKFK